MPTHLLRTLAALAVSCIAASDPETNVSIAREVGCLSKPLDVNKTIFR